MTNYIEAMDTDNEPIAHAMKKGTFEPFDIDKFIELEENDGRKVIAEYPNGDTYITEGITSLETHRLQDGICPICYEDLDENACCKNCKYDFSEIRDELDAQAVAE